MKTALFATLALVVLVHAALAQQEGGAAGRPVNKPTEVKWYPGHYLTLASTQPREGWKDIAGQQRFVGGQRIYACRRRRGRGAHKASAPLLARA